MAHTIEVATAEVRSLLEELQGRPTVDDLRDEAAAARADERVKVAQLLDDHAASLATFAADSESLVAMLAFMLRLGT